MHNKCDFFQEQIKKCNGLTANSGWAWRGVGKACWKRENAARSTLKSNPGLSARYSRNEVAGGAPPDRGRLIAAVVAIALGKRLPAARGCRASSTPQALAADAPHAFVGDAGS
jgi:hypothetical protein